MTDKDTSQPKQEETQSLPPDDPLWKHIEYWFEEELTTEHQKFFAITLSMFNGLKYPDFKHIYELVLREMKVEDEQTEEEENPLRSRFGKSNREDKLIALVNAELKPSKDGLENRINFQDGRYVTTHFDLLRRCYPSLLLDLLPVLKQIVEQYSYWDIRSRAALAVAEISKIGFHQVRVRVLEPWASNRHKSYIRASVGYPLARLSESETTRTAVENLLDDWCNENWSGRGETWTYRWSAASTYKQIGVLEIDDATWPMDWACQGLTKLAGFNDTRIADSVIHSLIVLSLQGQLERVLLTIKAWIEGGRAGDKDNIIPQTRCIVGILVFMALSEIHIELTTEEKAEIQEAGVEVGNLFELIRQGETEKNAYWQLMTAVGVRSFEYQLGAQPLAKDFLALIVRWSQYDPDLNTIYKLFTDMFSEVRSHEAPVIDNDEKHYSNLNKESLSHWQALSSTKLYSLRARHMQRMRNLNYLEEQAAKYSAMEIPLSKHNEIESERLVIQCLERQIKELEEELYG